MTAGNATIRDSDSVAQGLRTISLRIAGTEEAKSELADLGEDVEDYVVATNAKKRQIIKDYTSVASNGGQGVDILDDNGNLRSTYSILLDISKIYKEIQEEDKQFGTNRASALIEELAGKNRSSIAASILQNGKMLESVYQSSLNSEGSAEEELNKYLDSVEGKLAQLKNKGQEALFNMLSSDLVKNIIDALTNLVEVLDSFASTAGPALNAVLMPLAELIKGFSKLAELVPRLSSVLLIGGVAGVANFDRDKYIFLIVKAYTFASGNIYFSIGCMRYTCIKTSNMA